MVSAPSDLPLWVAWSASLALRVLEAPPVVRCWFAARGVLGVA